MDPEYIHEEMDAEHIYLPPFPDYEEEMVAWEEEENILLYLYASNNIIIAQYLEENDQLVRKGSFHGHIVRDRKREEGHAQLWNDYFSKNPTYEENLFRRRFRMRRSLYLQIVDAVKAHDDFFVQKKDGLGRLGLSTLQKVTSAFRMLAYGMTADSTDEYIRIGESTAILCIKKFCLAIVEIFGKKNTLDHLIPMTLQVCQKNVKNGDSQGCLEALIVCIGLGKIVQQLGQDNTRDVVDPQLLFLRQWPLMTYGFGMHSLAYWAPTTTLMS